MIEHFEIIAFILILIIMGLIIYNEKITRDVIKNTKERYYNLGYIDGVKRMEKEFTKNIQELSK
jgi:hypothetical protein